MAVRGIASDGRTFRFYTASRFDYGGANLALFLAMAMTESIAYDTCDEFNTDEVAGRFAISNSWYETQAVYICHLDSRPKNPCHCSCHYAHIKAGRTLARTKMKRAPLQRHT